MQCIFKQALIFYPPLAQTADPADQFRATDERVRKAIRIESPSMDPKEVPDWVRQDRTFQDAVQAGDVIEVASRPLAVSVGDVPTSSAPGKGKAAKG